MKKPHFFILSFLGMLCLPCFALNYTITFTGTGTSTTVDSVIVQNLTKGTKLTIPAGNVLNLSDAPNALEQINANEEMIRVYQASEDGKSIVSFFAKQAGNMQLNAYSLDGRKVTGINTDLHVGSNIFELSLPKGVFLIQVTGNDYAYTTKLLNTFGTQGIHGIIYKGTEKPVFSSLQKTKSSTLSVTAMTYNVGDQLLYTATSGTYIASVPDAPTASKGINFVFYTIPTSAIPAGTFSMGSPVTEIGRNPMENQYSVTVSAFHICKYDITNAQFAAFMNAKSVDNNGIWPAAPVYNSQVLIYINSSLGLTYIGSKWVPVVGSENAPVIRETWYGAEEYATYVGGTLPTEAQWEYACRAGTTTPFNTGNFLTNLQANYYWSSPYNGGTNTITAYPGKTMPVGTYAPNAYGLYDMHGNVWQWCLDWFNTYPTTAQTNPTGAITGSYRVIRGGSWSNDAQSCRSAFRYYSNDPSSLYTYIGFRVVFAP